MKNNKRIFGTVYGSLLPSMQDTEGTQLKIQMTVEVLISWRKQSISAALVSSQAILLDPVPSTGERCCGEKLLLTVNT